MIDRPSRVLVAGIGCTSTATSDEIVGLVEHTLATAGRSARDLACLATVDSRSGIEALQAAACHFSVALRYFTASELAAETHRLATPPAAAATRSGIAAVAEAAALKAGCLLVSKHKSAHVTCAIGLTSGPFDVSQFGRGAET